MRKIILIGLGVSVLTVLLSVITASLMAAELPSGLGPSAVAAVASSRHLVRLPDNEIGLLYFDKDAAGAYNVMFVTSNDNGETWSDPDTLNTMAYVLMIDPPDVVAGPNGDVFAVWDAAQHERRAG